jgi:hypothetical protein
MSEQLTIEQVARLRRFCSTEAAQSPNGREWLQRARVHAPELVRLYSGRSLVRRRVERALAHAAVLVDSPGAVVDDRTAHAFDAALTAIETTASDELRRLAGAARRELHRASGKTLREVLTLGSGGT